MRAYADAAEVDALIQLLRNPAPGSAGNTEIQEFGANRANCNETLKAGTLICGGNAAAPAARWDATPVARRQPCTINSRSDVPNLAGVHESN